MDDSETEFEEEIDTAHMCFMAHGDAKVNLENSLEDEDLTIDELAQFFEELQNRYEISLSQNKKLKMENDLLKNKFEIVLNEKNDLSKSFEKMKMDFEKYKTAYKGKSPSITNNKNEFLKIQKHVEVLDTTLKKCAFDMNKFASIFPKGKAQRKHILMHQTHTMKSMHTHINTSMHSCMKKYILVHIVAAKAIWQNFICKNKHDK